MSATNSSERKMRVLTSIPRLLHAISKGFSQKRGISLKEIIQSEEPPEPSRKNRINPPENTSVKDPSRSLW